MKTLIITLTLLTLLTLPPIAAADGPPQYSGYASKAAETEYYRGVYDTCLWAMSRAGAAKGESVAQCRFFEGQARQSDWYEQPSRGWGGPERRPAGWGNET